MFEKLATSPLNTAYPEVQISISMYSAWPVVLQPWRSYWCWLLLLQYSTAAALSQWVQCARTSKQTNVSGYY